VLLTTLLAAQNNCKLTRTDHESESSALTFQTGFAKNEVLA
jgi:hypothetical protein